MAKKDFTTSIVIEKSSEEVFAAIIQVEKWWSGEVKGPATALNDEFSYDSQISTTHVKGSLNWSQIKK